MTTNRTIDTAIKHTIIAATMFVAIAGIGSAQAGDATQLASVRSVAPARSEQKFDLRNYGDRFKLALEAIRKENLKPVWGWEDSDEDQKVAETN